MKLSPARLRVCQIGLLVFWQLPSRDLQVAFFMGEPIKVAGWIRSWFMPFGFEASALFPDGLPGRADIYMHLGTTLREPVLAFGIGTVLGLGCGLWLALAPTAGAILDPYIKAANSMPRVILAPIFALCLAEASAARSHLLSRWCFLSCFSMCTRA